MLKYEMIRVDDRLLHGQVLMKWIKLLKVKRVEVLSDALASDPILKTLLEKTIPDEILLKIWSVDEGTNGIYEQEGTTLLLVPDVDTLFKLYENGIQLKRVSISRLPCEMGKEKIYDHVFVSGEERKKLGILLNHGIDLRIQMVPDSDAIYLKDVL